MVQIGDTVTLWGDAVTTQTDGVGSCGYIKTSQGTIVGLKRKLFGRYFWIISLAAGGIIEMSTDKIKKHVTNL